MKRIGVSFIRFWTSWTICTVGPHSRLVQNFGVANTTTNGFLAFSVSATEYWSSDVSGGSAVVIFAALPPTDFRVGVTDGGAGVPTAGVDSLLLNVMPPLAVDSLPFAVYFAAM